MKPTDLHAGTNSIKSGLPRVDSRWPTQIPRRQFLRLTGASLAGSGLALSGKSSAVAAPEPRTPSPSKPSLPSTNEIRNYLLQHSPWVDQRNTVDTVKSGDPDRPVKKAGVAWFPSRWDIQAAVRANCDLLIVHEPTFWEHSAAEKKWRDRGPGIAKSKLLSESGLVILRVHDTWDNWPELGIRDSWAKFLGLTRRHREGTQLRWTAVYEIPETTLRDFARHVAGRTRSLGESSVQVLGEPSMKVRHPAIGVGCVVPDQEMVDFGADVLVVCFDGASYWQHRERLAEMGVGIITVEHGTSEMPGLMSLRDHLATRFPEVEFTWIAEHPRPWTVTS